MQPSVDRLHGAPTASIQGEEVLNTYGQLSSASLLHMYGFAELGNPHDKVCGS